MVASLSELNISDALSNGSALYVFGTTKLVLVLMLLVMELLDCFLTDGRDDAFLLLLLMLFSGTFFRPIDS